MPKLNITILDGQFANPGDLSWEDLKAYGAVTIYDHTKPHELADRAADADVIIINKVVIGQKELDKLPKLKFIVISATGMNNVDLKATEKRNIPVKNVSGYSTNSVAQHVWAMILELTNKISPHSESVKSGNWNEESGFSYTLQTVPELSGKNLGIYGLGEIGRKVAQIAQAFEMNILVTSNHAQPADYPNFEIVPLEELFQRSDVISLHAPLRENNQKIINEDMFKLAKPSALLINTARGPLIDENALYQALSNNTLAGAALDVLSKEPPGKAHPLFEAPNCLVTPHMAWTTHQSRATLIREVVNHVAKFAENSMK